MFCRHAVIASVYQVHTLSESLAATTNPRPEATEALDRLQAYRDGVTVLAFSIMQRVSSTHKRPPSSGPVCMAWYRSMTDM